MSISEFSPFFIVGYPRSGTTLLASLLDKHCEIAIPPETRFFEEVYKPFARSKLSHERAVDAFLANRRCADLGLDRTQFLARFSRYEPDYKNLLKASLEEYVYRMNKQMVGEKSPVHLLYMDQILEWYPSAKFIMIVRDGRDCVLSLMQVPWTHRSLVRHSIDWAYRMSRLTDYLSRHGSSVILVKYEDLLACPDEQLTGILNFLGARYQDVLSVVKQSDVIPEWETGWKAKANEPLDPSRVEVWKKHSIQHEVLLMTAIMYKSLKQFGYEVNYQPKTLSAFVSKVTLASGVYSIFDRVMRVRRRGVRNYLSAKP